MDPVELDVALDKLLIPQARDSIAVKRNWVDEFKVLDETQVGKLAKALGTRNNNEVINVSLQGFGLTHNGLDALVEMAQARCLRQLDLSFCRIGDEDIPNLTSHLSRLKIEWLDLTYNTLSVSSIPTIAENLNTKMCNIKVLSLRYNPITSLGLGALLSYSSTVLTLDVRCCGILTETEKRDVGLEAIIKGLNKNTTLNRLLMQGNGFTKDDEAAIHSTIAASKSSGMTRDTCLISDPVADPILQKLTGLNESMRRHNMRGVVAAVKAASNGKIPPLSYIDDEIEEHFSSICELESFIPSSPLMRSPTIDIARQHTLPMGWQDKDSQDSSSVGSLDSFENTMSIYETSTFGIPHVESIANFEMSPANTPRNSLQVPANGRRFMRRRTSEYEDINMQRVDTLPLGESASIFKRASWGLLASIIQTTPESTPREVKRKFSIESSAELLAECTKVINRAEERKEEPKSPLVPSNGSPFANTARSSGELIIRQISSGELTKLSSGDLTKLSSSDLLLTSINTVMRSPRSPRSPNSPLLTPRSPHSPNTLIPISSFSALTQKKSIRFQTPRKTPRQTPRQKTTSAFWRQNPKPKKHKSLDSSIESNMGPILDQVQKSPRKARSHTPPAQPREFKEKSFHRPTRRLSIDGPMSLNEYQPSVVHAFGLSPRNWPRFDNGVPSLSSKPVPESVFSGTMSSTAKTKCSSKEKEMKVNNPNVVGAKKWVASPSLWPEKSQTVSVAPPPKHAALPTEAFASKTKAKAKATAAVVKESPLKALGCRGVDHHATLILLDACLNGDDNALLILGEGTYYGLFANSGTSHSVPSLLRHYNGIPSYIRSLSPSSPTYVSCLSKLLFMITDPSAGAKPSTGAERVIRRSMQGPRITKKIDYKVAWTVLRQVRWAKPRAQRNGRRRSL